jgi:opacity protein-like surface antigen
MKKSLIATLIAGLAFSTVALAESSYIKLEGVHYNYTSSPNDQAGINLQIGTEVGNGFKADVKQEFRHEDNTGKTSNRFEGGLTYEAKVYDKVGVSLRGAVGEKYTGSVNYGYYLVEPGISYALTDALKLKASYRYRDTFNDAQADRTNTYKVGADYDLNKTTFLTGSLGWTNGDKEYTSIQGGVGIRF